MLTAGGRGVLSSEFRGNATLQADFDTRVKYLRNVPRKDCSKEQFRYLGKGLYEIKWKSGNKQWRALGFDSSDGYFVVVRVCNHKMNVYDPPDCIDRAHKLKAETQEGKRGLKRYDP